MSDIDRNYLVSNAASDKLPLFATDREITIAVVGKQHASHWKRFVLPILQARYGFPDTTNFTRADQCRWWSGAPMVWRERAKAPQRGRSFVPRNQKSASKFPTSQGGFSCMPRYFFDVEDNGELTVDEIGVELSNEKAVRDEAIRALPAIAREELPNGPQHTFWVKVRDDTGDYIFSASLELKSGWLKSHDTDASEPSQPEEKGRRKTTWRRAIINLTRRSGAA
jgi:hypothetical protein